MGPAVATPIASVVHLGRLSPTMHMGLPWTVWTISEPLPPWMLDLGEIGFLDGHA